MPAKEHLTEQIKYLTELLRLLWISLLGIGGGTVSLLVSELDAPRALFAAAGLATTAAIVMVLLRLDLRVRGLLARLEEA